MYLELVNSVECQSYLIKPLKILLMKKLVNGLCLVMAFFLFHFIDSCRSFCCFILWISQTFWLTISFLVCREGREHQASLGSCRAVAVPPGQPGDWRSLHPPDQCLETGHTTANAVFLLLAMRQPQFVCLGQGFCFHTLTFTPAPLICSVKFWPCSQQTVEIPRVSIFLHPKLRRAPSNCTIRSSVCPQLTLWKPRNQGLHLAHVYVICSYYAEKQTNKCFLVSELF